MTAITAERPLVVGIGDSSRGDDGAGPAVVALLQATPCDAELDVVAAPLDLLDVWAGRTVVVVDTVRTGAEPGTLVTWRDVPTLPTSRESGGSTHGWGLAEVVELAAVTDRLPAQLSLVGIEGASYDVGSGLCSAVAQALPAAAESVRHLVDRRP